MLKKQSPYISNASKAKKKPSKKKTIPSTKDFLVPIKQLDSAKIITKKQIKPNTTRVRENHLIIKDKVKTEPAMNYQKISRLTSPDFIKSVTNTIVKTIEQEGIEGAWINESSENSIECIYSNQSSQQNFLLNKTWNFSLSSTKSEKIISKNCQPVLELSSMCPTSYSARDNYQSYLRQAYYQIPNSNSYPYYLPLQKQPEVQDYTVKKATILTDNRTTVYIRHIPNKYSLKMLQQQIDITHKQRYNFLHLPFDYDVDKQLFRIIAIEDTHLLTFLINKICKSFMKYIKEGNGNHSSLKKCEIKYACVQGKEALVDHFYNTKIYKHNDDKLRPIFRDTQDRPQQIQSQYPLNI